MVPDIQSVLSQAIMITVFVAVMMIAVEYLNVLTRGAFEGWLRGSPWVQYLAAALLGALPGCLGAFTVVALYSHRVVTVGALVASMIATSGDEAFVMLALFPGRAVLLMVGLAALGFAVAPLVDRLAGGARYCSGACGELTVHETRCECFPRSQLIRQWRPPHKARVFLAVGTAAFTGWVVLGGAGLPTRWSWVRVTLLLVGLFGAFVVSTVPDHFLREHLWRHVTVRHVPRIFAWTAFVLLAMVLLERVADLEALVRDNPWAMLGAAGLLGVIPESGPHLVFVTLYAAGGIPAAILVASSIVQDGHGMLPLLAQSKRDFLRVKAINLVVGMVSGGILLLLAGGP
ncbi:MAG: putative manganese transporter [Gemmatimonadota bacterium]|jgi:hypothetical protein